ncbi:hypothetical protein SAMN05192554_13323 [Haloarchaeobius iranensis]|uniref:Uncharacterized protein n=1 Tax=Haloarchaeobius iranensis TaxID=996166 RepID=A0A1H0B467_9EURY|nr:hypothetical protein SAMN05192554_13323 [Haloarchaeobius iranensis]
MQHDEHQESGTLRSEGYVIRRCYLIKHVLKP